MGRSQRSPPSLGSNTFLHTLAEGGLEGRGLVHKTALSQAKVTNARTQSGPKESRNSHLCPRNLLCSANRPQSCSGNPLLLLLLGSPRIPELIKAPAVSKGLLS